MLIFLQKQFDIIIDFLHTMMSKSIEYENYIF